MKQYMKRNINITMRLLTMIMLMIFSMGAQAQVKVFYGESGDDSFKGGKVSATDQTKPDDKNNVTVTLTVAPDEGYIITKSDIKVYATLPASVRATRGLEISGNLELEGDDPKDLSEKRDYTVTLDAGLGLWVKEANFTNKRDASKGGDGTIEYLNGTGYVFYVEDGTDKHYMAHCENSVELLANQTRAVTGQPEFNPMLCLWETVPNPQDDTKNLLRAFGSESHKVSYTVSGTTYPSNGYYLRPVETPANSGNYGLFVSTNSAGVQSVQNFYSIPSTPYFFGRPVVPRVGDDWNEKYILYTSEKGWYPAEKFTTDEDGTPTETVTDEYTAALKPTVKQVMVSSYPNTPLLHIACPDIIGKDGAAPTLSATQSAKAYIHTVIDGTENHYWYDSADHDVSPTITDYTPASPVWSLATADRQYASIDPSTGVITVKKQVAADVTLTLTCTATVNETQITATKTVTLRGRYFVLKDDEGRYVQLNGGSLDGTTSFDPEKTVWTADPDGTMTGYSIISGSTTLSIQDNTQWQDVAPDYLKSAENQYVYWNTDHWDLTPDEVDHRVIAYAVTDIEQTYYTEVSATINGGVDEIDYTGDYNFTVTGESVANHPYEVYTFDGSTHYWYDNADHNDTPPSYWGDVSEVTKTWSLAEGDEEYATVDDPSTGELTVTYLPVSETVTITLKYTISKDTYSFTATKTITLKPEIIEAPTITLTTDGETGVTTLSITTAQTGATLYYEMGYSEPATKEPITEPITEPADEQREASAVYDAQNPPVVSDDVVCIKAFAVHNDGHSAVTTYNRLRFSDSPVTISVEPERTATVAPLIYSKDMVTPAGMTAYIASRVSPVDHAVNLTSIDFIPQGVPVLLLDEGVADDDATTDVDETRQPYTGLSKVEIDPVDPEDENKPTLSSSVAASNLLKVSDGTVTVAAAQVYMYHKGEFVLTLDGTLKEGRFYLNNPNYLAEKTPEEETPEEGGEEPEPSPSRARLFIAFDHTTAIKGVDNMTKGASGSEADVYYTLDGRRLIGVPTRKGIYVCRGRKIVVR